MGSLVALLVSGVIAVVVILLFVVTVISLVLLVAVAALVGATGDILRHVVFVRRFRSLVFFLYCLQPNGAGWVHARCEYATTRCFSSPLRFSFERLLERRNPHLPPNPAETAAVLCACPFLYYLFCFLYPLQGPTALNSRSASEGLPVGKNSGLQNQQKPGPNSTVAAQLQ